MKYIYNPVTNDLDDTQDKNYQKKTAAGAPIQKVGGFNYYDTAEGIDHFTKTMLDDDSINTVKQKSDLLNLNTEMKEAVIKREAEYFKKNQFDSMNKDTYPSNPVVRGRLLNLSELEDNIIADPATRVTRGRYANGGATPDPTVPTKAERIAGQKQLEKLAVQPDSRGVFKKLVAANEKEFKDKKPQSDWDIIYSTMTPQEKGTWNAEQRKQKIKKNREKLEEQKQERIEKNKERRASFEKKLKQQKAATPTANIQPKVVFNGPDMTQIKREAEERYIANANTTAAENRLKRIYAEDALNSLDETSYTGIAGLVEKKPTTYNANAAPLTVNEVSNIKNTMKYMTLDDRDLIRARLLATKNLK